MLRLIIWLVLLFIIGRIVWRFMYAIFDGAGHAEGQPGANRRRCKLVRDPVCGVFVVPGKALTAGSGGVDASTSARRNAASSGASR